MTTGPYLLVAMATCAVCSDNFIVNGKMLACRYCQKLYHPHCVKVKETVEKVVKDYNGVFWFCDVCIPVVMDKLAANLPSPERPSASAGSSGREGATDAGILDRVEAIVSRVVAAEIGGLQRKFVELVCEVGNLKDSNLDLIRLLDNNGAFVRAGLHASPDFHSFEQSVSTNRVSGTLGTFNVAPQVPPYIQEVGSAQRGDASSRTFLDNDRASASSHTGRVETQASNRYEEIPSRTFQRRASVMNGHSRASKSFVLGSKKINGAKIVAANIPKKTSVFVSKLDRGVSADDLLKYIQETFGAGDVFGIDEQTVRSGDYTSYRVEIKADRLGDFLSPSNWPEGVLIKKFRFFRVQQSSY